MSDDAGTLTLARTAQPETDLEVKRSHFLGRAARTRTQEEARAFIASVRTAHPTYGVQARMLYTPNNL